MKKIKLKKVIKITNEDLKDIKSHLRWESRRRNLSIDMGSGKNGIIVMIYNSSDIKHIITIEKKKCSVWDEEYICGLIYLIIMDTILPEYPIIEFHTY